MQTSIFKPLNPIFFITFLVLFINCNSAGSQSNDNITIVETQSYNEIKNTISIFRNNMHQSYIAADSIQKDSILQFTQNYLHNTISTIILPQWYETVWDFNGISETPKKGAVACGMFVTVILKDAGFNISRIKSGQLASEVLIKKLTKNIKRFSNQKMDKIIDYMEKCPDGLYIVGLDTHVGFINKQGKSITFIHSNYYSPHVKVMSQQLSDTSPLTDSGYRIIGKILDYEMTKKWILNEKIDG